MTDQSFGIDESSWEIVVITDDAITPLLRIKSDGTIEPKKPDWQAVGKVWMANANAAEDRLIAANRALAAEADAAKVRETGTEMFQAGIRYAAQEMDALADTGSQHGKIKQKAGETYGDAREWLLGLSADEVSKAATEALAAHTKRVA